MSVSEVARLRQQIASEYAAAVHALYGYASVSKHEFIESRMTNLGVCHQKLINLLGEREATKVLVETIEQVGDKKALQGAAPCEHAEAAHSIVDPQL
jgi:hypothetical protein